MQHYSQPVDEEMNITISRMHEKVWKLRMKSFKIEMLPEIW